MGDTDDHPGEYARLLEAIVESHTDALIVKDLEGRYRFANAAAADFLGCDPADVVGKTDAEFFDEESARSLRERELRVLDRETAGTFEERLPTDDSERVFQTTCSPYYDADGRLAGTVLIYRDVTARRVRERILESQRDELATLDRINEVVHEVIRTLIGEPTREEIERTVCDRLVESELYHVAWVAEPVPATGGVTGVVGAGLDDEVRDLIADVDVREDSDEPFLRAYYSGQHQIVQDIPDADAIDERLRAEVVDRGTRSAIAVPIRYGNTTYGVLTVGSTRLSAFSEREADAFDVLGEVIGFAIGAVKHRRLALSDTVVEVELRVTDADSFFVALADELDCRVRLDGMTAGPEGSLLFYDAVSGADPDAVLAFAAEWETVEDARVVSDGGEETLFEFTVSGSSLVLTLSEYGANTTEAVSEAGEARVVAELPADVDVRGVVERVRAEFPGLELAAKRETERDLQTAREFRRDLDDRLTEAQRTALRASFFAGYYEWPRDSTAEEVADSLGVSSPTFHQHIRKAQRELLGAFFDRDGDRP